VDVGGKGGLRHRNELRRERKRRKIFKHWADDGERFGGCGWDENIGVLQVKH